MVRYVVICLLLSSPVFAEVCDRSKYPLDESRKADSPVQEARINFTYESGVIVHTDGARETVYCIRNDVSNPVFVKWHGPNPDILLETFAPGGGRKANKAQKSYASTTTLDGRTIQYDVTKNYGKQTNGETITFADSAASLHTFPALVTPNDLAGRTMSEMLADADLLDRYLEFYRSAPEGGNELVIWSYAGIWLPADSEALVLLAAGEEIEGYDGPYIPVSYGLRSGIDIDNRLATSAVQFSFGDFSADDEAYALAQETDIRNRLSVVTAEVPFTGLSDLKADADFPLSEAGVALSQVVLNATVREGETARIVPWTVGLAIDGIPFSAMQADLFTN